MTFDYIIVGAGSAGCVLANRLSEDPNVSVALIEAGGSDRNPLQRIPAAGVFLNSAHPERDWCYKTEPDPSRNGRTEEWSRGRLLGGTSSLNGMIYVRGARADFDHWASLGNRGWSFEDVEPVFRRMENHELAGTGAEDLYGSAGPLKIRRLRGVHPLSHAFVAACGDIGIEANPHYNGLRQDGATILSATQSSRARHSSSQAFLIPAIRRRNLHVIKNSLVSKILFEGCRAVGVRLADRAGHGRDLFGRETLVSGGAIESPHLLMLSGVGPADELRSHGVEVVEDLPGVGLNLQDHPLCKLRAKVTVPTYDTRLSSALQAGWSWLVRGGGPLMSAGCQALAFVKTDPVLNACDAQLHMIPGGYIRGKNDRLEFIPSTITFLANVNHTHSRGRIGLRSSDPFEQPAIFPNMLSDYADVRILRESGRMCRQLLSAPSLAPYVLEEQLPGPSVQSDEEWDAYLRETSEPGCHHCGTCKMGTDPLAVVDERLKVRGIAGLRVVDASVMPTVTSGNTNASTMMIAFKAADMILEDRAAALPEAA